MLDFVPLKIAFITYYISTFSLLFYFFNKRVAPKHIKPNKKSGLSAFVNQTTDIQRSTQLIYCIVGPLTIPFRICLLLIALLSAAFFSFLGTMFLNKDAMVKGDADPLNSIRSFFLYPVRISARLLLFTYGICWIKVKGKLATKDAPIIVSNHTSFIDPVFLVSQTYASPVSADHSKYPFFGNIIALFQPIFVDRGNKDSSHNVMRLIKERAVSRKFPATAVFPEGTTCNGMALINYKLGAFAAGVPIQPVIITYPNRTIDCSWVPCGPPLLELLLKMFASPYINMTVEYLPVYSPSSAETNDAKLFARNVRDVMARAMNVGVIEQSFEDMMLMGLALKHNLSFDDVSLFNLRSWKSSVGDSSSALTLDFVKGLLGGYCESKGLDGITKMINVDGFVDLVILMSKGDDGDKGEARRDKLKTLFKNVDTNGRGLIDFTQVVLSFDKWFGGDEIEGNERGVAK